ncbi:hypothetical protein CVT25_000228 [Psilocybe cyanescens]|uniref:Uncharacterized protein n=1 Tax=Psilocybe cyanescens TaxID=93625 RepID=A0A409WZ41_PSICY|nr:hypothetical protein CVT25_000228 [Psilocybe cyanescens]
MVPHFSYYLKVFLNQYSNTPTTNQNLCNIPLPFTKFDALPKSDKLLHGQFDTVVAIVNIDAESTELIDMI